MTNPVPDRRNFLKASTVIGASTLVSTEAFSQSVERLVVDNFQRTDSLYHGAVWESQNPGYWQIKGNALRRRLKNYGDRARRTGFPFHSSKGSNPNGKGRMETEYDPSLPVGILWSRANQLTADFSVEMSGVFHGNRPSDIPEADKADWKMYSPGHGLISLAFGGKALFESYQKVGNAVIAGWTDTEPEGTFKVGFASEKRSKNASFNSTTSAPDLKPGDNFRIAVTVKSLAKDQVNVATEFEIDGKKIEIEDLKTNRKNVEGYVGIAARGLIDFEVNEFAISTAGKQVTQPGHCEALGCWAIGDSLKEVNGKWQVKFMNLFASDGKKAEIRISTQENPEGGWEKVPVAGEAKIVNHEWRRNTAVVTATFPEDPGAATHFYTVWKDGINVTADERIGTPAVGPGTGFVGDVPASGSYVGRLPQLVAPYRLAGLSCHAITSGLQTRTDEGGFKMIGGSAEWQFRDQPSVESYKHLEDYDFQIMVWEDDVWYMELVLYPPSTDDAYKVVANSICGPTSRWQMMRHWNVINPGDHDYGMDDVKGPEQIAIRKHDGLGQDASYMRRNFQIVHHLVTGEEEVDPLENPKKWRAWKMPNRDFTFVICDSRLWRSSQDTDMWDDAGWDAFKNLYDRTDPTRSLLGEEQFSWLSEVIRTDSSPLICLTGVNGLHTIWTGRKGVDGMPPFDQRDRVVADYAGWVKAGADRVLELLGSRDGLVTVYGDVHNGCIMTNKEHRVVEASFGPIGRSGGRGVIPGFGREMKDFDERDLTVHSLYHKQYSDPDLAPQPKNAPFYWNFLEMHFDPTQADPAIEMRVRNLIDPPTEKVRGGGELKTAASQTGRAPTSQIEAITTLPNADVRIVDTDTGKTIRATRSLADGTVPVRGLIDVAVGTEILVTAVADGKSDSKVVVTSNA